MRSTVTLNIEISHSQNLPTDAQGIADIISKSLTEAIAADPLASAVARVYSAAITNDVHQRLEELRTEIRAERISYGEIAELQGLAEYIDRSDVELLEWAGVPEFEEEQS